MTIETATHWFRHERLDDRTTLIDEPHVHPLLRANMFLIEGSERDMILDTGMGLAPLRPYLDTLRNDLVKPIVCVSSHTHVDHVGGAWEFGERLVHAIEAEDLAKPPPAGILAESYSAETRQMFAEAGYPELSGLLIDALPYDGYDAQEFAIRPAPATGVLQEGDRIDLGDIELSVLHLPGHAPGQIGLFREDTAELFAADAIYDGPLICKGGGTSIPDYRKTFDKLQALPVRRIHGGHDPSFDRGRMMEIIADYRARWDQEA